MKVSVETNIKKPKSYKVLSETEIKREATKLSKDDNKYVADVGKAILNVLVKGAVAVTDLLSAVNVLIFTAPAILADVLLLVISALIFIVSITPTLVISKALKAQKHFLKSVLKNINEPTKQYFNAIDDITNERVIITEESANILSLTPSVESITNWDIALEAPNKDKDEPTDYTKNVDNPNDNTDEPKDYTEDVTTNDKPEPVDNTEDDEPTDYTQDVKPEDDNGDTGTDTGDTPDEPTDYTQNVDPPEPDDTGNTEEDVTTNDEPEPVDNTEDDEPTDYTQDVDGDNTTDNTNTTDDTTDDVDNTQDTTTTDSTNDENTIVKNYNLLVDFQNLHTTISEILDGLHDVVYPQPIQNQVLTKGINNLQEINEQIEKYVNYSFSNDYKKNTYYYTVYLQACKMNLEMLRKNYQLGKE